MVCLQYRLSELVPNSPSQTGTPPSSPHDSMKPHLSSTSATKTSYSPKRWCKDSNKMRATNDTTKAHKRLETSARMHNACLPPDPPPASGTKGRPCPGETAPANIATPRSTGEAISRMEISRAEASEPWCQQEGEHREEGQQKCDPGPQNCVRDAAPSPGVATAARSSGATSATQQAGGALRKPSRPELAPVLQEPRQDHNEAQEATPDRQGPQVNADPMPGRQVKVHPGVLVRGVDDVPLQLVMQVDRVVGDGAQKYAVPKSGHDNEHARVLGQHKLATLLRSD
mmetsp:Transcript_44648/g.142373  ORF Transcript_44648/g.142373 Transcript_44648/m.142373 type:complete len:285 (+) Transcript_44648:229-1083(+)